MSEPFCEYYCITNLFHEAIHVVYVCKKWTALQRSEKVYDSSTCFVTECAIVNRYWIAKQSVYVSLFSLRWLLLLLE